MLKIRSTARLFFFIAMFSPTALYAATWYGYCEATNGSGVWVTKIYQFSATDNRQAITVSYGTYADQFNQYTLDHYGWGSNYGYAVVCGAFESNAAAASNMSSETSMPDTKTFLVPWIPPGTSLAGAASPAANAPVAPTPPPTQPVPQGPYKTAKALAHPIPADKLPSGCAYTSSNSSEVTCE